MDGWGHNRISAYQEKRNALCECVRCGWWMCVFFLFFHRFSFLFLFFSFGRTPIVCIWHNFLSSFSFSLLSIPHIYVSGEFDARWCASVRASRCGYGQKRRVNENGAGPAIFFFLLWRFLDITELTQRNISLNYWHFSGCLIERNHTEWRFL